MCLAFKNSVSHQYLVEAIVAQLELSILILDENGCMNKSPYALCFQEQHRPTGRYGVPVDLYDDG